MKTHTFCNLRPQKPKKTDENIGVSRYYVEHQYNYHPSASTIGANPFSFSQILRHRGSDFSLTTSCMDSDAFAMTFRLSIILL